MMHLRSVISQLSNDDMSFALFLLTDTGVILNGDAM